MYISMANYNNDISCTMRNNSILVKGKGVIEQHINTAQYCAEGFNT
jgi:hypothetical protein